MQQMKLSPEKIKIRQVVQEVKSQFEQLTGKKITYPLKDAGRIFSALFGLSLVYDDRGILNSTGEQIIGCLYPDGHPSPWGRDKLIVVNITPGSRVSPPSSGKGLSKMRWANFNPETRSEAHTISHEGFHYVLHFLQGIQEAQYRKPIYCRALDQGSFFEWQVDFGAGELLMPHDQVTWILDGMQPPELVVVDQCWSRFRQHFNVNRMQMETRLRALGYELLDADNDWADYRKTGPEREARRKEALRAEKERAESQEKIQSAMKSLAHQEFMWKTEQSIRELKGLRNPNARFQNPFDGDWFGNFGPWGKDFKGFDDIFGKGAR